MPKIRVSKFVDQPLCGSGEFTVREHLTECPDGTRLGRIDYMYIRSVKDAVAKVKGQIIKDGSEFGFGTYKTTLTLRRGYMGPATGTVKFEITVCP